MNRHELMSKIKEKIKVEGRSSLYNPLLQKPTRLEPVGPGSYPGGLGGYAYIGPPPDFGGSYGAYQDDKGRIQVGVKSSKMFSMYDGAPVQLYSELKPEERQALLSQIEEANESHKCSHCRSELLISVAGQIESSTVHCPHCGSEMGDAVEKIKQCISKLGSKENVMAEAEKAKEPLHIGTDAKDVAKEAMKVEMPQEAHPHEKPKKAEMMEHEGHKPEEYKAMEELAKAPAKASVEESAATSVKRQRMLRAKAAIEKHQAKRVAAKSESRRDLSIETRAALRRELKHAAVHNPEIFEQAKKNEKLAPICASIERTMGERSFDAKTLSEIKRELRIASALNPELFEQAKAHYKLAPICAQVEKTLYSRSERAKCRAELKALAKVDVEAAEEAKEELDFVAPEILMEEPVEFHPEAEGMDMEKEKEMEAAMEEHMAESKEEHKEEAGMAESYEAKSESEEEEEEAEAAMSMKTEHLASIASLKGEKIEMSLYNEESANPFWNLVVDGEPVARINLADQKDSDQIRASFVSDAYAENFGNLIGSVGLEKVLEVSNAKVFAHRIDESEITARLREKAKAEAKAEMSDKMETLRSDFMRAVSLAMVAADKNFYQEDSGNALKGGLFNALVQAGLSEQHAVWAIEAGFEDAPEYFKFVTDKAIEIMDTPKEARESLEKHIMASGKIEIKASEPEEDSLMNRLIKSSVNAVAMGGIVNGEDKTEVRKNLGLTSNRR